MGDVRDAGVEAGGADASLDAGKHDAAVDAPAVDASTADGSDASDTGGPTGPIVGLASWEFHACALRSDGEAYCWGYGGYGALGNGGQPDAGPPGPVVVPDGAALTGVSELSVGFVHGCARTTTGSLLCWGDQTWGETGITASQTPQLTADPSLALPGQWLAVASKGWNEGSPGEPFGGHNCAIDTQHRVWCWGANDHGQLGHQPGTSGDVVNQLFVYNATPQQVTGLPDVKDVALANGLACVLTTGGTVACWGWNGQEQLANGMFQDSWTPVVIQMGGQPLTNVQRVIGGHDRVCAMMAGGDAICWGRNTDMAMGLGEDSGASPIAPTTWAGGALGPLADLTIGQRHICAVRASDGSVWCAGYNAEYELGTGNATVGSIGTVVQVVGPSGVGTLQGVLEVSACWASTCARTASDVYCWGDNDNGETGHAPGMSGDITSNLHSATMVPTLVQGLTQ